jgi:hypothetical protein
MDDWKIEARNDARASKAIRGEQIPSEIQPKIPKSKRFSPTMDTFNATTEYVNSLDFRDNALEAQMAKISTNAIQDKLGWKPSTIKSDVTKEMILDYQQEMRKPIVVNGEKYNYHPSTVDIDKIEYDPPIAEELTPAQIIRLESDKDYMLRRLEFYQQEIVRLERDVKQEIRIEYDNKKSSLVQRGRQSQIPQLDIDFDDNMERIDRYIEELNDIITDLEVQIDQINFRINSNERNKRINQADRARVDKENAIRLKAYKEDLNQLNKGRLNIEQQPNESDDEFRDRLRDTGMMTYDEDAMSRSAELYNREKMKERMMEIHRDTAMIGNALKSFDADQLFKMNKNWSTLKQNFIKIYGFNSPAVRDRDIVDFFTSQINPLVNAQNSGDVPTATAVGELIGTSEFQDVEQEETQYGSRGELSDLRQRLRDREPPPTYAEAVPFPLPPTGFAEAVSNPFPYLTLEKAEQLRVPELQAYVDQVAPKLSKDFKVSPKGQKAKIQFLRDNGLIVPSTGTLDPFLRPVKSQSGEGIQPITHDLPKKIQFGKIHISPKKLYYDNVLAIRHKSGKSFSGVPDSSVSDKFVSIIMNLLKGQKPSLKDFSTLDVNEKGMYDSLIYMAGLQKEVDNTFNETKNNLKNRLELLEGEIGAGNNNPKLKKELLYLLSKMVKTGMVGGGDAKRYYMSVCK